MVKKGEKGENGAVQYSTVVTIGPKSIWMHGDAMRTR